MTQHIHNPHDAVFKAAMSDIRVATDFFAQHLPAHIHQHLDPTTLQLCANTYIENSLKLTQSDVLYRVELKSGEPAYLYILAEHQSTVDPLMPYRVIEYMVGIWRDHRKQTGSKVLPLVVPLVFYNGDKPYSGKTDIRDLIQAPVDLIDEVLFQPFILIDVNTIADEVLRERIWSGLMAFLMKHIRAREILVFLKEIVGKLHALEQQDGFDLVVILLSYVLDQVEASQHEAFVELVQREFSTQVGEKVMTTGEYLREQGRQQGLREGMTTGEYLREQGRQQGLQKGKQEGRQEGEAALLMRQLLRKFHNIPKNYHERIEHADAETLLTWGERVLEAETLEAIFAV